MQAIEKYIDNLKRLTGTQTDTALAKKLGIAKQTISSWRHRGTIPTGQQYYLTNIYGPEAAFYPEIGYAANSQERQVFLSVFLEIYDMYRRRYDPRERHDRYNRWAQAFLNVEHNVQDIIRQKGFLGVGKNGEPSEIDRSLIAKYIVNLIDAGHFKEATRSFETFLQDDSPMVDR